MTMRGSKCVPKKNERGKSEGGGELEVRERGAKGLLSAP